MPTPTRVLMSIGDGCRNRRRSAVRALSTLALLAILTAPELRGQAPLTGTIAGSVVDPDGDPLPGVTVTATASALQGSRGTVSGPNGDYVLRNLPVGAYQVSFTLEGLTTIEQSVVVDLGRTSRADAAMRLADVEERITVEADTPTAVSSSLVGANYADDEVDRLPIDREPISIADFSPGVSDRGAIEGQISISGGIGYDNLIMLDGVDTSFFIWGNANGPPVFPTEVGLFIEDAIEETQVLTGTISPEFGRFSGGVVNAVTRRGGNHFRGSVRVDLTNPAWREESPIEEERGIDNESNRNELYSATLGGYVLRDRLWFFAAAADTSRSDPSLFPISGEPQPSEFDNRRFEVKLTGSIGGSHTLEGLVLRNDSDLVGSIFGLEPRTIDVTTIEHDYSALRYTGVLGPATLVEGRYSERQVDTSGFGGSSPDIRDSPFIPLSLGRTAFYNAPVFDETDPSLNFDDEIVAAIFSRFVSTESAGSHDLRIGLESFSTTQYGGNSQSSSEFLMIADFLADPSGTPILDAQGRFQPLFLPFGALAIHLIPDRDAVLETTTSSLFVNDLWRLNDRWSFNVGLRYEEVEADATPDVEVADFDSLVPRLAATYSPGSSGRYRITAGYGEYVGRANSELFKSTTTSRNASEIDYLYVGPPGAGIDFDPGFDLSNYFPVFALFPTANAFFEPGLSTPRTVEIALSGAVQLPGGGYLEAALIDRSFEDAFESFIEIGNGRTLAETPVGPLLLDNVVYRNTDLSQRDYLALQVQGRRHLGSAWTLAGHWTWEIENDGNFVGEESGNPAVQSSIGTYPELRTPDRNFPVGPLPSHLEHKLRLWSTYQAELGRAGSLDLTLLLRYDSPLTYSHTATVDLSPEQLARDPGYATPPVDQTVFFGGRGNEEFEDVNAFDLVAVYRIPVRGSVEPWLKLQVRNVFDSTPKRTFDTTIIPDLAGPVDADGLPTEFIRAPTYGQALSPEDFYPGRELLVSLGVRF